MKYIYSTLTNHQKYTTYIVPADKHMLPEPVHSVVIAGGANLADKKLVTPRGVATKVSDEDFEHLKKNEQFQAHVKNGFITYRDDKVDPEVAVAAGMKQQDTSAPYTPNSPELNQPDQVADDGSIIRGVKPRDKAA
jgi:hypothetical protein